MYQQPIGNHIWRFIWWPQIWPLTSTSRSLGQRRPKFTYFRLYINQTATSFVLEAIYIRGGGHQQYPYLFQQYMTHHSINQHKIWQAYSLEHNKVTFLFWTGRKIQHGRHGRHCKIDIITLYLYFLRCGLQNKISKKLNIILFSILIDTLDQLSKD